jgi:hypothetical protein
VRDLAKPVNDLDLIYRMDRRRQAAVDAEYLVVDHHAQGKEVEHVGEVVPHVGVAVFPRALCIEPIGLCNAARLMVSADEVDAMGVSQFQTDKEGDRLDAKQSAVDIIPCNPLDKQVPLEAESRT